MLQNSDIYKFKWNFAMRVRSTGKFSYYEKNLCDVYALKSDIYHDPINFFQSNFLHRLIDHIIIDLFYCHDDNVI